MENQGDVYLVVLKDFEDESVGETVWELVPLYLNAPEPEFGDLAFLDTINDSSLLDSMVVTEDALSEPVRQKLNRTAPNNFSATVDPTVDNDSTEGWEVGSVWINTITLESFRALDVTEGAAQWMQTTLTTDELAE